MATITVHDPVAHEPAGLLGGHRQPISCLTARDECGSQVGLVFHRPDDMRALAHKLMAGATLLESALPSEAVTA